MKPAVRAFSGLHCAEVTGARRGILKLPGVEEDVGLIGIHWQGRFIELVPWTASVNWHVAPWGSWKVILTSSPPNAPFPSSFRFFRFSCSPSCHFCPSCLHL